MHPVKLPVHWWRPDLCFLTCPHAGNFFVAKIPRRAMSSTNCFSKRLAIRMLDSCLYAINQLFFKHRRALIWQIELEICAANKHLSNWSKSTRLLVGRYRSAGLSEKLGSVVPLE